mmetsp:Transcript_29192/g.48236  ORF Transcript_29192/g.48236 Transcript_29192/m.48236 type:complete len:103 (+) Transcript_29192:168-476(+)
MINRANDPYYQLNIIHRKSGSSSIFRSQNGTFCDGFTVADLTGVRVACLVVALVLAVLLAFLVLPAEFLAMVLVAALPIPLRYATMNAPYVIVIWYSSLYWC